MLEEYCVELKNTEMLEEGPEGRLRRHLPRVGQVIRRRQGPVHPLYAGRLRNLRRHGLQGARRPARIAGRHRSHQEAHPGACARGRDRRDRAHRRHAHPEAGRHRESAAGRHRHAPGARSLHQVTRAVPCTDCRAEASRRAARRDARLTASDLFRRLEELNQIGIALSKREATSTGCSKPSWWRRRRSPTPTAARSTASCRQRRAAAFRDHAHRFAGYRHGRHDRASAIPFYPVRLYDDGRPRQQLPWWSPIRCCSDRRSTSPMPTRQRVSISPAPRDFDSKTGYRSQVLPDRADEEPRRRNHRRAAADQCQGSRHRGDRRVLARRTSASPSRWPRRLPSR